MQTDHRHGNKAYVKLAGMAALHFAAMYILMYAMVDSVAQAVPNANQLYMAGLMTAPMLLFETLMMRDMYPNGRAKAVVIAMSLILLAACFAAIRTQAAVNDRQFLKSMIPHHSGAILMCRKAQIADPRTQDLCRRILQSQKSEIEEMQSLLDAL